MIEMVLAVTVILYLALQVEDKLRIPSPLSLIAFSFVAHLIMPEVEFAADAEKFAAIVLLLLPILLVADSLELRLDDLKEHALSLFYLAVVAVVLSVVAAILFGDWLFGPYDLSVPAIIVLFAMVLATDPVSVVSIFSKFELPHRLKILAEGESLFNDATALIVFVFVGLYALDGGEITGGYIVQTSLIVVLGSVLLGGVIGYFGLFALKTTANRVAEMMVVVMVGYGAFYLAEHFYLLLNLMGGHSHLHFSGILSCIAATVTVHHWMTREIDDEDVEMAEGQKQLEQAGGTDAKKIIAGLLAKIKVTWDEKQRHLRTQEDIQLLALVANTILFVAMAEIVDLSQLLHYGKEIMIMFVATTVIRAAMMAKFAIITNQTDRMTNINFRWWGVLTFAGIKGGLSIVMLSMIPESFPHLDMFKAVVIGVIILSTFVYVLILLLLIGKNREVFKREKEAEIH